MTTQNDPTEKNAPLEALAGRPLPNLFAIVAVCDDWGIGLDGDMVVSNRADMRHYVRHTKGHTILMGRRTLESFPGGRPLKDRRNVVVTRDESWAPVGAVALRAALVPMCSRAVVTKNHCVRACDTFFPNLDADPAWRVESRVTTDDEGNPLVTDEQIPFEFDTYVRA